MDELAAKQVLLDFELITLIALLTGVALHALVRKIRPAPAAAPSHFDGYDLLLMFFPALLFLLNPVLEVAVAQNGGGEETGEDSSRGIGGLFVNLAYFGFVGVMTYGIIEWVRNRRIVEVFGLTRLSFPAILVCSITGGVASLVLCAWALGNFSQNWLRDLFNELPAQEAVEALQNSDSTSQIILAIAMACVVAPIVEEMLFRGYMYGALKQATSPVFSAVIVGALFAVVHGNLPAVLPLWGFSILLCCAYEWTRCLWVPIGMHAFFNGANILLMHLPQTLE